MSATIIDGKYYATKLNKVIFSHVNMLKSVHGINPGLAVILVGDDPASQIYVRNKINQAKLVGIQSFLNYFPKTVTNDELIQCIKQLNCEPTVNGILVQLPLPMHINTSLIIEAIIIDKDVDGFSTINAGLLMQGSRVAITPCTPMGCLMLLRYYLGNDLTGKHAVILGRSNIVGKPMSLILLQENCTVTTAHSYTSNLAAECVRADILISAVGKPNFVKSDWIKPGATIIDIGINRILYPNGQYLLCGDVDFLQASLVAKAITPVPGGVGPMTVACLLLNTLLVTCRQQGITEPEYNIIKR